MFALLLGSAAVAAPDPTEQIKPVIDKITTMLTEDYYKKLSREQQFDKFLELAAERFDFDEMSKRVLGPQWNSLPEEQKELFINRFTRLLGYTYMDKIDTYAGEPIIYEESRIRGNRAEVRTSIQFKNGPVPISYITQLKGSEWMTYDLVVEN
ncbi:MAG: ABC transporter substrate-binding protein, partial [Desulfobulbaceae bacterium]|nr:ABC transporter substrate-binding protein [Desulfobulbaceae bacterium]